jgi:hypothetical protein
MITTFGGDSQFRDSERPHVRELDFSDPLVVRGRTNWPAIWAGVLTFMAIWLVFGTLGVAIFASASPAATYSLANLGVGMGIWTVVAYGDCHLRGGT